ncbi:aspartate kinase [Leeuwenhoekiella aestuarii]|uniref:Aspartokinase n=1 Tax=Leeuwenhoekiella aestuarii TaxID=2249426 RepID=A0A4Q0NUP4_9FLAO|nr:aspartate kinase [Leeuwenhoekiella aestuarii]RXG14313.1 aspartate kinase [Leeuwenhoekiella aestuarii]RXG19062.1 aspartate kinase [Leeuwenhoekiella aestuarii]
MGFEVYKFGGASVQNATGVKNLVEVLRKTEIGDLVIVISAMGKMTNALEDVVAGYFEATLKSDTLELVEAFHHNIALELFENPSAPVFKEIQTLLNELKGFLQRNKSPDYDFVYDQVVCYGELLSTTIVNAYLEQEGYRSTWHDIREYLKTDTSYREGKVNWEVTMRNLSRKLPRKGIQLTQGFIASDANGFSTTLGREGSDYTAAIIAYCLNAERVTIWKDVPGVLSADPRYFEDAVLLNFISYQEAIELAFYGASVIHPKTLQPLQRKEIPLFVKSFLNPENSGTQVSIGQLIEPHVPCYIRKTNQVLIALSSLDFSFMAEENIGEIFKLLGQYKMKVDLIQNSAISFSVCVDNKYKNLEALVVKLRADFKVTVHQDVSLYTLRHATDKALVQLEKNKEVLLKQVMQNTVQLVTL